MGGECVRQERQNTQSIVWLDIWQQNVDFLLDEHDQTHKQEQIISPHPRLSLSL